MEATKHIPFPEFSCTSELFHELLMFAFVTTAAAMQFMNIYRTIWWLPDTYVNHAINTYLIDPYLVCFIVLINIRRLIYCLLTRSLEHIQRAKQRRFYRNLVKYSFGGCLLLLLLLCVIKIYVRHTYLSLFLLIYPAVVYILIFGFQIEPFLRSSIEIEGTYFNGLPMHCCSSNPLTIREEVDELKNDFNNRFKQVVFTSVVNAYYGGFVPCFFAASVYYNVLWATQNIILIWLSCFTMTAANLFPSKYSDILHRASLHLGHWMRCDFRAFGGSGSGAGGSAAAGSVAGGSGSAVTPTALAWNKTVMWDNGNIVKHCGDLYCSVGLTVAVPGNSSHSRFYKLFHNPSIIYMVLTTVQAALVFFEIVLLFFTIEWHYLLSISFITLTNQYTFFRIMRDYLITKRIYTAETSISDRQTTPN